MVANHIGVMIAGDHQVGHSEQGGVHDTCARRQNEHGDSVREGMGWGGVGGDGYGGWGIRIGHDSWVNTIVLMYIYIIFYF